MSSTGAASGAADTAGYYETTGYYSLVNPNELGKDDFLKLLSTQLAYQDPLQPVADYSFIAQLAQFSSLEQMYNLGGEFRDLRLVMQYDSRINTALGALAMVGMQVTVRNNDDDTTVTGSVEAVKMLATTVLLTIGGQEYDISQVEEARPAGGETE